MVWRSRTDFVPLGDPIGNGSFGQVWKALFTPLSIEYAIKEVMIDKTLRYFGGDLGKLYREVRILQKLNNVNVVRYYSCWFEGTDVENNVLPQDYKPTEMDDAYSSTQDEPPETNFLYIQMELCSITLRKWLNENSQMMNRIGDTPQIFVQLVSALKYIHECNIVHRDLKPENIFRKVAITGGDRNGEWKIGDFGLSLIPENSSQVISSSSAGDARYRSLDPVNSMKSDVFSLGLVMLEVLDVGYKELCYSKVIKRIHPGFREILGLIWETLKEGEADRPDCSEIHDRLDMILNPSKKKEDKINPVGKPIRFDVREPGGNLVKRKAPTGTLEDAIFQREDLEILAILGLGGVGKSELGKTFVKELLTNVPSTNCLWFEADSEKSMSNSILRLGREQNISGIGDHSSVDMGALLQLIFKQFPPFRTLLVIDNLDEMSPNVEKLLRSFRNYEANGLIAPSLVITTRNRDIGVLLGDRMLELNILEDHEAVELVMSGIPNSKEVDATNLCNTLQNFPLALQQAVAYIKQRRGAFGISKYLEIYEIHKKRLLDHKLNLKDHDYMLTTLTTWNISFERVKTHPELGSMGEGILKILGHILNPHGEQVRFVLDFLDVMNRIKIPKENLCVPDDERVKCGARFTIMNSLNPAWAPRTGKYYSLNYDDDYREEVDIEDDIRHVAHVVKLIWSFSLVTIDTRCYGRSREDLQFLSMHRLVQEIIRLNSTETDWVVRFSDKIMHPEYRVWSMRSPQQFMHREKIIELLWGFVPRDGIDESFCKNFYFLWFDSVPGYIPRMGKSVLEEVTIYMESFELLKNSKTYFILKKFLYHISISSKEVYGECDKCVENLFQYFADVVAHIDEDYDDALYCEILDVVISSLVIREDFKGCINSGKVLTEIKFVMDKALNFLGKEGRHGETVDPFHVNFTTLFYLTGKVMEDLDAISATTRIAEVQSFCESLGIIFGGNDVSLLKAFKHIPLMIMSHVLNSSRIYVTVTKSDLLAWLQICEADTFALTESDMVILGELDYTKYCNAHVARYVIHAMMTFPNSNFSSNRLFHVLSVVLSTGYHDEIEEIAIKFLILAESLCHEGKPVVALNIISAIFHLEGSMWRSKLYPSCVRICQQLPTLLKFRNHFESPDMIANWMDGLITRARKVYLDQGLIDCQELNLLQGPAYPQIETGSLMPSPVQGMEIGNSLMSKSGNEEFETQLALPSPGSSKDLVSTLSNSLVDDTPTGIRNIVARQADLPMAPVESISLNKPLLLVLYWNLHQYEAFYNLVTSELSNADNSPLQGYTETKMARVVGEALFNCETVAQIPTKLSTWFLIFALKHNHSFRNFKRRPMDRIMEIVDVFVEKEDEDGLLEFGRGMGKLGMEISKCFKLRLTERVFSRVRLPNFWHIVYAVVLILRKRSSLEKQTSIPIEILGYGFWSQVFDWEDYPRSEDGTGEIGDSYFPRAMREVEGIIKSSELSGYPVIIAIICEFLDEFELVGDQEVTLGPLLSLIGTFFESGMRGDMRKVATLCYHVGLVCRQKLDPLRPVTSSRTVSNMLYLFVLQYFSISSISDRITAKFKAEVILGEKAKGLSKRLKFYKALIKFWGTDETLKDVQEDLLKLCETVVKTKLEYLYDLSAAHGTEIGVCLVDFVLRNCTIEPIQLLVVKVVELLLADLYNLGNFYQVYTFGLEIAGIPTSKIVCHERQDEILKLILKCLEDACEKYVGKMVRIFSTVEKTRPGGNVGCDKANEYATNVDIILEKFDIQYGTEVFNGNGDNGFKSYGFLEYDNWSDFDPNDMECDETSLIEDVD